MKRCLFALAALAIAPHIVAGATLFESGTVGTTDISWQDVSGQVVLGENVNSHAFNGVRFELTQPVVSTQVGGHFVGSNSNTTFFAAIIELDNASDSPDSVDLSTPDVLGTTLLTAPQLSDEISGNLSLALDPGWYALVFGSGLFGANGAGAALLNNSDIGTPDYIGFLTGFGWGERLPGKRFFVNGNVVPEPISIVLASISSLFLLARRMPIKH